MTDEQQSTEQPDWREILKDSSHPFHQAAWLIFARLMDAEGAAKILSKKKEVVLPYLYQVLENENLFMEGSLGDGYAPVNSIKLLRIWDVREAAPHLLRVLLSGEDGSLAYREVKNTLYGMMPEIRDTIIAYVDEHNDNEWLRITIAGFFALYPEVDSVMYAWIQKVFEGYLEEGDDDGQEILAEMLLQADATQAIPYLETHLKQGVFSRQSQAIIRRYVANAKQGKPLTDGLPSLFEDDL